MWLDIKLCGYIQLCNYLNLYKYTAKNYFLIQIRDLVLFLNKNVY